LSGGGAGPVLMQSDIAIGSAVDILKELGKERLGRTWKGTAWKGLERLGRTWKDLELCYHSTPFKPSNCSNFSPASRNKNMLYYTKYQKYLLYFYFQIHTRSLNII
jgi:hypothetical protein